MWSDLFRVAWLWRARWPALVAGLGIAMLSALAGIALMTLAGKGVAEGVAGGGMLGIAALLWLRPFVLIRPAARWWERMASHDAAFRALADTRVWFFRRLAERRPGGIGMGGSGDLLGRLIADVDALDRFYLGAVVPAAGALAAVLAIAILLGAEPWLLLLMALPLLLALVLPLALAPAAARAATEAAARRGEMRAAAVDPLAGLEDTLAANAEPAAATRLATADAAMMRAQRRLVGRGAMAGALGQTLTQLALLGGLAWGLWAGEAGAALAVLALFLGIAALEMLGLMPRAGAALATAGAGARRLFETTDTAPPVEEPASPAAMPEGRELCFEKLRFGWRAGMPPVLDALDLTLRPAERLAILGPSGAGKSSIAALLMKFAAPQGGRITLGGADIATLAAPELRGRIAYLAQDARLFDDSIANNLRIAAPGAPDAALWRALAKAGVGEFVRGLPEGLDTICGEGGARFSGGEARRIALARALLPPADILILDEPTAGLDAEAARSFLVTLGTACEGRSLLLLTHELTGVEPLDRVLRLAGGRLLPAAG